MKQKEKISAIRKLMEENGIDACIIPSTDPHMGEYIPGHWSIKEWVSGFSGSAGTVVITKEFAGLWTDSRYFLQAESQLKGSDIKLVRLIIPHTPEHIDWLAGNLPGGSRVAIDGRVCSVAMATHIRSVFDKKGISLVTDIDIPGAVWKDRPPLPLDSVFNHDVKYSGESRKDKISRLRDSMIRHNAGFMLLCALDEIAWLFNLRGTDISYNPVFVSYALISMNDAILFINPDKISCELLNEMQAEGIGIMDYADIHRALKGMEGKTSVLFDPSRTNISVYDSIPSFCSKIEVLSPVTVMKAVKNKLEIEGLKKVMVKDGVAWVKFLHWLHTNIGKTKITELSAANKLDSFRAQQELYQGASFHPISSFASHGAIVHYSVNKESDIELKPDNIYLCDTGGHYLDGTTDTTRTVTLGKTTKQQKKDFTLALKGTIGLSMLRFPKGTRGYQMDIIARKALWDHGLNYGHGTGHGVGFFLNVHEGPQNIGTGASGHMNTPLEPGMVTTVEPAIYREGEYGMRTENITLVVEDIENDYGTFYRFETLTLAPVDTDLIDENLLSQDEKDWLNNYHFTVIERLGPFLEKEELRWLKSKARHI
jgi:Xaa-Pro aminopeptidase